MKMKTIIAIMTLICTLFMVSHSFAEPTQDLWDFLADEGFDTSDSQIRSHVFAVEQTQEALDVALTMEGLLYDGEHFILGWRTENLRPESPALVLYTEVTVNGATIQAYADHPVASWWPAMFGLFVAGDPINNLMGRFRVEDAHAYGWQGEVEVVAHFIVKRPTKPMVVVDPKIHEVYENEGTELDRQAMIHAMQSHGVTIAGLNDMDVAAWQDNGFLVVNQYGEHFLEDGSISSSALKGTDLPDAETKEVKISFRVNLDTLLAQ